jgi:heme-binding NEAT domain protein
MPATATPATATPATATPATATPATKPTAEKKDVPAEIRYIYEVILSFDDAPQEFTELEARPDTPEEIFVANIITGAGRNASQLVKISTCLTEITKNDVAIPKTEFQTFSLPAYLAMRNGKYFFNSDVNEDADTVRWRGFRDGIIIGEKMGIAKGRFMAARASAATARASAAAATK